VSEGCAKENDYVLSCIATINRLLCHSLQRSVTLVSTVKVSLLNTTTKKMLGKKESLVNISLEYLLLTPDKNQFKFLDELSLIL
jgi:hypothetical protein